jgi:hypothetical protein
MMEKVGQINLGVIAVNDRCILYDTFYLIIYYRRIWAFILEVMIRTSAFFTTNLSQLFEQTDLTYLSAST